MTKKSKVSLEKRGEKRMGRRQRPCEGKTWKVPKLALKELSGQQEESREAAKVFLS